MKKRNEKPRPRGGLRRLGNLPETECCRHPAHKPPGMIVLLPGLYEYECPGCSGKQLVVVPKRQSLREAASRRCTEVNKQLESAFTAVVEGRHAIPR